MRKAILTRVETACKEAKSIWLNDLKSNLRLEVSSIKSQLKKEKEWRLKQLL